MKRLLPLLGLLTQFALAQERVISLDYCADQYVLALSSPKHIAALSPAAASEYSYLAAHAINLKQIRPTAEQVLLTAPDLVVRQWGGGYNAAAYLAQFNIPIAQITFGNDIASTRSNLRLIGASLGLQASAKAEALIAQMDVRLAQVSAQALPIKQRPRALYITPGGLTAGADTFIHELMLAAGVTNMGASGGRKGWQSINLEHLALDPPDLIIGAFFDLKSNQVDYWSIARHRFLRETLQKTPNVLIPSAQMACPAWFFVDAVETIHAQVRQLSAHKLAASPP